MYVTGHLGQSDGNATGMIWGGCSQAGNRLTLLALAELLVHRDLQSINQGSLVSPVTCASTWDMVSIKKNS